MKKYIFVLIALVIAGGLYYFYFLQRGSMSLEEIRERIQKLLES